MDQLTRVSTPVSASAAAADEEPPLPSELSRLYEAERQARLDAEAAMRARDEYLVIAAHELKTPLTAVKSAAQLVTRAARQSNVDQPELVRLAGLLETQITRLETQVRDLLDVSRLHSGHLDLLLEPADLATLCAEALARAAHSPARGPRNTLTLDAPEPCVVICDPVRLGLVFDNLLANTLGFVVAGGEVRVSARRDGERAIVAVSGTDLDPEMVRAGHDSLMAGLFITSQTIERHYGTILINASYEDGITYTVNLPIAPPTG